MMVGYGFLQILANNYNSTFNTSAFTKAIMFTHGYGSIFFKLKVATSLKFTYELFPASFYACFELLPSVEAVFKSKSATLLSNSLLDSSSLKSKSSMDDNS